MSYTLTLECGCVVYVARNPATHVAHTRVLQSRGAACPHRRHEVGLRLYLWELLPPRRDRVARAYDQDVMHVTSS
ncbi:MAG TPA: hypothetical protein VF219_21085 [Vicinamibacterales bacterium]